MVWDELGRGAEDDNRRDRDRWIGVYIGILAVLLAVCSMGGSNAGKEATLKTIEASNTWAFFQAKNIRRQVVRTAIDEMTLLLETQPGLTGEARAAVEAKIAAYKEQEARLTSDPKDQEGLDELFTKGKALETARNVALRRDPYFDYGQALLQIAIVLASVTIISGGTVLLAVSVLLGWLGVLATVNGFSLLFTIPFLG